MEVGKGLEESVKRPVGESLPLVSSKKAGQCASAPCSGQTGSRSAPRVDNGEGSGGVGVRCRIQGSSQK